MGPTASDRALWPDTWRRSLLPLLRDLAGLLQAKHTLPAMLRQLSAAPPPAPAPPSEQQEQHQGTPPAPPHAADSHHEEASQLGTGQADAGAVPSTSQAASHAEAHQAMDPAATAPPFPTEQLQQPYSAMTQGRLSLSTPELSVAAPGERAPSFRSAQVIMQQYPTLQVNLI